MGSLKSMMGMIVISIILSLTSIHSVAGPISFFREASPGELLRDAAFQGDLKGISKWLNKGVNVDWTHPLGEGWTPLIWAVHERQHEAVELLLQNGAGVNKRDKMGCTPLYWASLDGDPKMIDLLLSHGARLDIADLRRGWDPLMRASYMGHNYAVKLLLDRGANPNRTDKWGNSALTLASYKKKIETATLLIARGAVPNAKTKQMLVALQGNPVTVRTTEHIKMIRNSQDMNHPTLTHGNVKAADITLFRASDGSNHRKLHAVGSVVSGSYEGHRVNAPVVDLSVSPLVDTGSTGTVTKTYTESSVTGTKNHRHEKAEKLIQKAISIWNQLQREFPNMADELLKEAHKRTHGKDRLTQNHGRN